MTATILPATAAAIADPARAPQRPSGSTAKSASAWKISHTGSSQRSEVSQHELSCDLTWRRTELPLHATPFFPSSFLCHGQAGGRGEVATCRFGGVRPASSGGEATQMVIDDAIGSAASTRSTQRRVTSDGRRRDGRLVDIFRSTRTGRPRTTLEGTVALLRIQDRTTHF